MESKKKTPAKTVIIDTENTSALLARIKALEGKVAIISSLETQLQTARQSISGHEASFLAIVEKFSEVSKRLESIHLIPKPDAWRAVRITKYGHIHAFNETPDVDGDSFQSFDEALQYARDYGQRFPDEVIVILPVYHHPMAPNMVPADDTLGYE